MTGPPIKAARCKGPTCHAPIFWAQTKKTGANIPINLEPDDAGNVTITDQTATTRHGDPIPVVDVNPPGQAALFAGAAVFMPHHATCPDVEHFRAQADAKTKLEKPEEALDAIRDTLANTKGPPKP